MEVVGVMDLAVSTAMTAIIAGTTRITRMNVTTNTGVSITIAATVDTIMMSCMSMTGAARRIRGEADHDIDLDRARHEQTENIVSVTIGHTVQPDRPHPQSQTEMGTIGLHRDGLEIKPRVVLQTMVMRMGKGKPRLQAQILIP